MNDKSQAVRLIDVLVLGPFLIWVSNEKTLSPNVRGLLALSGVLTIWYNGANYLANRGNA